MPLPIELKPVKTNLVIDLVRQAGVDVADWANYGRPKYPGANPKYCYEWAFVQPEVVVVVNLWYDLIREVDGQIEQRLNLRDERARQETIGTRRARRQRMEAAILLAYGARLPVRVIVLDGSRRSTEGTTSKPTQVSTRTLDPVAWAVTSFNEKSGDIVLQRGISPSPYVDQFTMPAPPDGNAGKRKVSRTVRERSLAVRLFALDRARGKCELCGCPGFMSSNGSIFLETHHVIPLEENGPDSVKNVVAICPTHHREAHYGCEAQEIRHRLLKILNR